MTDTSAQHQEEPEAERPTLASRVPTGGTLDPDEILDRFLGWVADMGFELYPAQEEALLEVIAGRHVILDTPTGSGKSLVALGLHFKALCEGRMSVYTSPIKALASEKFFDWCRLFGPERVAMLTGDASINPGAPVVCCTAEVLANMVLRQGADAGVDAVVMDEFHYYADPERGWAWQVPLIEQSDTVFLLMSATLGDTAGIARLIEERTGRTVATVSSEERPVPLDFEYRETPIHETVQDLATSSKVPAYVVSFTQRDCAELAQSLTSLKLASPEERERIGQEVAGFRFDTPYGKEFRRFVRFGVAVHHAGLLPKYRLLAEQLAQRGRLKVICGTDTLGVGVNIPIRTVVFSKLAKFDGRKLGILKVRDFKQIAGRAGRRGFDERGSVVCQAPDFAIEKAQLERKAGDDKAKRKKLAKKKQPQGEVQWDRETFDKLIQRPPETLQSRFRITHGMIVALLQRDADLDDPSIRNFDSLRRLIERCHESDVTKQKLLHEAAVRVRSLHGAGIIELVRDSAARYLWVVVNERLQADFSLYHALSLYLVETLALLDMASESYALDVLSLVESVLEDPVVILRRQVDRLKDELVAEMKAEGSSYEERIAALDKVIPPAPLGEFIFSTFEDFRRAHPWVGGRDIRPKSVGREMVEGYLGFSDMVRRYGLQRSEGILLRYLSQLYRTLDQTVPDWAKTEEVEDVLAFFRTLLERVDTSLLEEWESLRHPELLLESHEDRHAAHRDLEQRRLLGDPRALTARVRAGLHQLVHALAQGDWEEAADSVRQDPEDPWDQDRLAAALAPFLERYDRIVFDQGARFADKTRIAPAGDRRFEVSQVLVDPEGDNLWAVEGVVDLSDPEGVEGPLVRLERIGT